jgi:hypothetical protein
MIAMIKMKPLFVFVLGSLFPYLVYAQDAPRIGFDARFYDKSIYYVNSNDINIKLTLTNNSPEAFRFKVADIKSYTLDFEVKTSSNTFIDHSEKFTIEKKLNQPVMYREVSIESGEEYGFVVELNQFVKLDKPGLYTVQALFYPELVVAGSPAPLRSNRLALNLRPPVATKEMEAVIEAETGKALQREPIAPDDVVSYLLNARQRSQWEKFFLYIDLESLYERDPVRGARYKKMSQEERVRALEDFNRELRNDKVEQEILVIPRSFEILETTYRNETGTVIVLEKFAYRDYTEKKRYTYYLAKKDRFWLITDYTIENLGTE